MKIQSIANSALVYLTIAVVACTAIRTAISWKTAGDIEHTSGTWIAMAADVRDGILYRPISVPGAFGGSRYAPLHPLLQGALLKMGMGYLASGFAIEFVSMIAILIASWLIMQRLGANRSIAACFTALILASSGVADTIAANKADLLAASLNLWGLLAIISIHRNNRAIGFTAIAASLLFALATAAKITSIFGLGAGVIWLFTQNKKRPAIFIAALWLIFISLFALTIQYASNGRALDVFRACAAGGAGIRDLLCAPLFLIFNSIAYDKPVIYLWIIAAIALAGIARKQWLSLPVLFFLIATAGTTAIFGTPGININHLVDLHIATLILLATQWSRLRARWIFPLIIATVVAIQCTEYLQQTASMYQTPARSQWATLLDSANASATPGPILSENPLLPLLDGERPYLLDSFMFRVINKSRPDLSAQLWTDLSNHRFKAVILSHPLAGHRMYTEWNFGEPFIDRLKESYELKLTCGDCSVFYPKRGNGQRSGIFQ